ncbi:MAG: stage II sporulation protein M [Nanoarchaeota archaeon]|nr:stage II sporulation protein M [Nanoarchaeota archaeon]MBU1501374.1 stage II sporulation protein M [Nanoarchaeota archaeon]MBU2459184.1 stage II sporulation protein M [Nanoarchaeota archaeon]
MLESLINPSRLEKGPIKMFFIGIVYASLSLLLVKWFFSGDSVLSQYSGMIVVTFCVMFSLPFFYYIIRQEEDEDEKVFGVLGVWRIHKDAIFSFMWLFMGFIVAFSFWFIVLQDSTLFNAQIETFCSINSLGTVQSCVEGYSFAAREVITGSTTNGIRFISIIENNVYVMIFTLLLSLIFGAGAIFVLAWNASVIAAAVAIFTDHTLKGIPLGISRYMIHGLPEISAYFITALAGGIFGVGVLRNGFRGKRFVHVFENVLILLFIALIILVLSAAIEVYITPLLF